MKLSTTIMALGSLAALVASAPINTDEAAAALDVADASNVDIATDSTSSHNTGSIEHDPEHNWCYAHKTMTYLRFHVAGQHWNGVNITEADFRSTVDHCGLVTEFEFWPDGMLSSRKLLSRDLTDCVSREG